jgi:2-methylcitrate dehydratase PrpD
VGTIIEELSAWTAALRLEDVPERVRRLTVSQLLGHLGALFAGARHPVGVQLTSLGAPLGDDVKQSAAVMAALSMALDFDDTVFAGHVSHSAVGVPLAYARCAGLDGDRLLLSILAATEVAARVTATATLGPFRGQTAAHTHLAGAITGRCVAERCDAAMMVDALALAFAAPPWPLQHAFFGSDAKLFTAATPIRSGLDAVDAARAGLHGAPDMLEHPHGFLATFASTPLPQAAGGLGTRWHTDTLSIKVHPGCAYIDSAIDAALRLHPQVVDRYDQISSIEVDASIFTVGMEERAAPYLAGPASGLAALNFSTGWSVACALRRGALEVEDFAAPRLDDETAWRVARLVQVRHDPALSRRALLAAAPIGAALRMAGRDGAGWLGAGAGLSEDEAMALLGEPEASFEDAEKAIGARLRVRFADGSEVEAAVDIAEGAAGADTRMRHREIARAKFVSNAGPLLGAEAAERIADTVEALPGAGADAVRGLLDELAAALR